MKLKLILKQSFRDFLNKFILYLTFTFFLILAISVSLGMISFSQSFKNSFSQTIGNYKINALLTFESPFLPEWVDENGSESNTFLMKEQRQNNHGYLYNFLDKTLKNEKDKKDTFLDFEEKELNLLTLGIGFLAGNAEKIAEKDLLENKILAKYFSESDLKKYNENIIYLRKVLNENYQTINLVKSYFLEEIKNNADLTLGGFRNWTSDVKIIGSKSPEKYFYWEYLRAKPEMKQIYSDTPWTIQANISNTQKIWTQINFNNPNYKKYWQSQHIVYVQPAFLHQYGYQIGKVLSVRFTTWDSQRYQAEPIELLIAGTTTTPDTINLVSGGEVLFLPFKLARATFYEYNEKNGQNKLENFGNLPVPSNRTITFNIASENGNPSGGQKVVNKIVNRLFMNLKNPKESLGNNIEWTKFSSTYTYDSIQVLFLIIAYVIGIGVFALLFVVFYFITQQIIALQAKTLFFLKTIGVGNHYLSILTTFTMLMPIFSGLVFSFFGALGIQTMMYQISFEGLAFYLPFFSFSFVYFMTLILIIFFSFLIFYLINLTLIKSKTLTLEGLNALKTNAKLFEVIKIKLQKTSSKFRVNLSFTFKNLYKNLISYFILAVSFGITLFQTQFSISLTYSASTYEKWNQPYRSVNYAEELYLFAPTKNLANFQNDEYVREYQVVSNLDNLFAINSIPKLLATIGKYQDSLSQLEKEFNWKNYYLEEKFVKETLDWINEDPKNSDVLITAIKKKFPEINELKIRAFLDQLISKYRQVQNNFAYQGGFTILMGQVFAPIKNRTIFTSQSLCLTKNLTVQTLAFEKEDWETKNYFGFNNSQENDFVIDNSQIKKFNEPEKLLRINISAYLQSISNFNHGDMIELEIQGLKSATNLRTSVIHAYVDQVVKNDTVNPTIYTSQVGIIQYLVETLPESENPDLVNQKVVYENLLKALTAETNSETISNTVFDEKKDFPLGIRYLTLPLFHHTDPNKIIGSRIEDFYDEKEFVDYWNKFGQKVMIFNEVTKDLLANAAPFTRTLEKFVWILLVISFVISIILIALILLENREVILLFKAMGYKKSEINWYLISGYLISIFLAMITGIAIAIGILTISNQILASYLKTNIYFIWSWEFLLFAFGLAIIFSFLIFVSITVYTNTQNPKNAFEHF